jgi:hypothetical protein
MPSFRRGPSRRWLHHVLDTAQRLIRYGPHNTKIPSHRRHAKGHQRATVEGRCDETLHFGAPGA